MAQYKQTKYEAEVLDRVPDMHLPVLQSCVSGRERIYTVDGFVDETGELYISLACVKISSFHVALEQKSSSNKCED